MLHIEMLPARMGDCLFVEYGMGTDRHRIVIDGGTAGTYDDMLSRFEEEGDPGIDLWVVTHIDNDHIAGVLKFLEQEQHPVEVREVWFNGFRHLPESPIESLGPVQGERLTARLLKPDFAPRWNTRFEHRAVAASADGDLPTKDLPGGMKLTVLAPGPTELAALRPIWLDVVGEANLDPRTASEEVEEELPPHVERLGPTVLPDVEALAAEEFDAEDKEANGSSIVLYAEYGQKCMLFTGDTQPHVLLLAIDRLVGEGGTLELDLLQAPHHGGKGNVNIDLVRRVHTQRYLFSSSGPKSYKHPNQEAVARVLVHGEASPKRLFFNYKQRYNKIWAEPDLWGKYRYTARYPDRKGQGGIVVDLEEPIG